jgi:hypothetical protein
MTNELDLSKVTELLPVGSAEYLQARPGSVRRVKIDAAFYYVFTSPDGAERSIEVSQVVGFNASAYVPAQPPAAQLPSWSTASTIVDQQKHAAAIEAEELERKRVGNNAAALARAEREKAIIDGQAAAQRGGR